MRGAEANYTTQANQEKRRTTMTAQHSGKGVRERLEIGAVILAHAQVVDTNAVKRRLLAFTSAHRSYADAQEKVAAAEAELRMVKAAVARRSDEIDAAVDALALALANDGHPRTKPFAALGLAAPSEVKDVPIADKVEAMHALAAAAQGSRAAGRKTCEAARAVDDGAKKLQTALAAVAPAQSALDERRRQRDALGLPWDRALAVLRRDVRSAEDEGATGLYAALFGPPARSGAARNKSDAPTSSVTPPPPTAPAESAPVPPA
jgi:hypothetical protein